MDRDLRPYGCALTGGVLMTTSALCGIGVLSIGLASALALLVVGATSATVGLALVLDQPLMVGLRQRNQS